MDAGPWQGFRNAILRLWTRRDATRDDTKDGHSPTSGETMTAGGETAPVATVSHSVSTVSHSVATVSQPILPPLPVPAPPVRTPTLRLRPPGEAAPLEEVEENGVEQDAEASVCKAQEQLDTLIRNRGYLVKDHIPRKVLEEQVMENIRRRERIARILRHEEAPLALVPLSPGTIAAAALIAPKDPPPPPEHHPHPERSAEMIHLLTKVWSGKGASVQGRGTGEVDWTRSQFVMECLGEHNRLRSLHSAPPLVLSEELCNDAQAWANRLAHFGLLEYSSEHGRGENIMTSSAKEGLTGCAVARGWYETGRNFKYDMNGSADLAHAGPFSQVVWESTRAVGVGCARGSDNRMVVVARYWPQGNVGGQFSTNVKPPTSDCPLTPVNTGTPTMSRTRQEAHFYVSIALEPPGKNKKTEKEKIVAALKLPTKKMIGDGGVSGETLLAHPTTLETLGHSFTVCRNGAARTSKLFPICCVTPAKTEERWATPSARTQYQTQQPQSQADLAIIRRTGDEARPSCTGSKLETGVHLSAEPLQKYKSNLKASPRLGVSPRLAVSPRLGVTTRLGTSPKMGALPKLATSRMTGSPKLVATSRFGGSPKRGSPKRSVLRCGGSPKPGSSPRRSATSRLRALTAAGEHGVVVATL